MYSVWKLELETKTGLKIYGFLYNYNIKKIVKPDGSIKYKNY